MSGSFIHYLNMTVHATSTITPLLRLHTRLLQKYKGGDKVMPLTPWIFQGGRNTPRPLRKTSAPLILPQTCKFIETKIRIRIQVFKDFGSVFKILKDL